MTRFKRISGSLLARLALGYVLVTVVFAGAWLWSLHGPLSQAALGQQQRNLTAVAQSAALVAGNTVANPAQIAEQLVARTDLRLTIVAADGAVIADSHFQPEDMENHGDRPEIIEALAGRTGAAQRLSRTGDAEELYVAVPALIEGARVALRVSQPIAEIEAIAQRSRNVGLLLLGGALCVAIVIAYRTVQMAARPVQQLSEAARQMANGNLEAQVPAVPTDLASLAHSLASLRDQVRHRLEALEAERQTLRATLDGLRDGVFVLEGTRICLANQAASHLFREPPAGWRDVELGEAGLPGSLEHAIRERLASSSADEVQLEPDPKGRVLRLVVAPLGSIPGEDGPDDGALRTRTIVSVADMTEQARLDSVRRDFVANASHELKTPVLGIHLLAESAENAAHDGDVEQALLFARQIEAETHRLQLLVGDLLDLSRLEATPDPRAIADVRMVADNAILSHRSAAARKGLSLEADLSAVQSQDVFVASDATDVTIALDNLLDNAIAYTSAGHVKLVVTASPDQVTLAVSDTGRGISAEHQPRVFERFYRVDRDRSRDSGGTGLGLALVRHVVERNGGSVSLVSAEGEGSTFTVVLPRAV